MGHSDPLHPGRSPRRPARTKREAEFASGREVLEAALRLFELRKNQGRARASARASARAWHAGVRSGNGRIALCRWIDRLRLDALEREVVCGLLLWHFDLIDVKGLPGLWRYMGLTPRQVLRCHASLREQGRLAKCVYRDEDKAAFDEERVTVDPNLAEVALEGQGEASPFAMHRESQVMTRIGSLGFALAKKADAANDVLRGWGHPMRFRAAAQRCRRMLGALDEALSRNPGWELARLQAEIRATPAWTMFVALLARESGEAMRDDDLGTGRWLALAAAREPEQWRSEVRYLRSTSFLRRLGLVEPCGGPEDLVTDDLQELERVSFGLGPRAFDRLGLDRRRAAIAESRLIQPRLRLADLALSAETGAALALALAQAAHAGVLLDRWGLGRTIAYGRGVTLLFSGPPGTGKTAAAEALAGELGAPLLVADYSRIQQSLVGQTEKNIVRAFQEARRNKAVLFWDEADAMFHDRDTARYAWEVRDVNVLLQEVERFDGVCVLATNRTGALDKALARRIAVKVEFPRPDRPARSRIWRKLIPAELPLAGDVDLDEVAAVDLSGGEIKNAVLNAARMALVRGAEASITQEDLRSAARMEARGSGTRAGVIGFTY